MKRTRNSAFRLNEAGSPQAAQGLAGLLAAMRATLEQTGQGWLVRVEPMHALDALGPWSALAQQISGDGGRTIIFELPQDSAASPDFAQRFTADTSAGSAWTVTMPAAAGRFEDELIGLDDFALRRAIITSQAAHLVAVLVDGPLEPADVQAIGGPRGALEAGRSPLAAELRAVCAMSVQGQMGLVIEARERRDAVAFVAENFRHYLAALRNQPASSFAAPEIGLVDALFDRAGVIQVRPIETEVFSTAVDVGVFTRGREETGPADASLIYDIYSNSWHGD